MARTTYHDSQAAAAVAGNLAEDLSDLTEAQGGPDKTPEAHERAAQAHELAVILALRAHEMHPEAGWDKAAIVHQTEAEYHHKLAGRPGY